MSFNAGEIVAKLRLEREEFYLQLDKAKADVEAKFKEPIDVSVKPELDEVAVEEVLAEEEPLRKDIEPEVKPQYARAEAEQVGRSIGSDILSGIESESGGSGAGSGGSNLVKSLFGQGLSQNEVRSALKNLGFTKQEIQDAMGSNLGQSAAGGGSSIATDIIDSILPSPSELDAASGTRLAAIKAEIGRLYEDIASSVEGAAPILNSGKKESIGSQFFKNIIGDIIGSGAPTLGGSPAGGDLRSGGFLEEIIASLAGSGATVSQITSGLRAAGIDANEIGAGIASVVSQGITVAGADVAKEAPTFFQSILSKLSDPGALGSAILGKLSLGSTPMMMAIFNPLGAGAAVAFLGAFGAAIAGGIAATFVGAAGSLVAIIPGFLDLTKGYAAYQAISTHSSTKGMTKGQLGLGSAIGKFLGGAGSGLHGAENMVMPDVTKFIDALTKAMPLIDRFARPAIRAMSGFFNVIDKGMSSKGFKSFMKDMDKVVGPIMKEFGQVLINLGTAFGGFLKLFAGVGAHKIGPWFVKVTGELSHFLNHVKLGHGFVAGMVTVFSNLGKILPVIWNLFKDLGVALAPVGLQIFRILGWLGEWAGRILKFLPPWLVGGVIALAAAATTLAIGLMGLGAIMTVAGVASDLLAGGLGLVGTAMAIITSPITLIVLGIIALGVAVYELWKHWKTVWNFIKIAALDAWHFLDDNVIHPIADFFAKTFTGIIQTFGKIWGDIWKGIQSAVETVWKVLKPIFDVMSTVIGGIVGGISKVTGFVGHLLGGGPSNVVGNATSAANASGSVTIAGKTYHTGHHITINVDARNHSDPSHISAIVRHAVGASIPSLQAALARGAA